jgi:benzoyl-CoA reductase/2-hydroxyglutaryl-CoA dehydratase subunit BcrC/BadD/HgdB
MGASTAVIPDELLTAYRHRTAAGAAHYKAGGKVCGYFGNGMPIEIAMATGHMPMAIQPLPDRPTPHAEEWLNTTFDPQLRLILDQLLSGELTFVDLAVAVSQSSPDSAVFQAAREILRQGYGEDIPPLHHYSLLGLQSEAVRDYGRMEIHALANRLRSNSGQEATAARLKSAIELTNAIRAQWRLLDRRRHGGYLSGTDALTLIAPAHFMQPADYLNGLTTAIAQLKQRPAKGPRLVLMSSVALSDTRLHEAIESAGATVIGESDFWGACCATPDIALGDDALEALYMHYYTHVPNRSVYPATVRLRWFFEHAAAADVDGVVIHMPRSDRALGWDYPRLCDFLDQHKKPFYMTREDASTAEGRAAITQATAKFANTIQERKK